MYCWEAMKEEKLKNFGNGIMKIILLLFHSRSNFGFIVNKENYNNYFNEYF